MPEWVHSIAVSTNLSLSGRMVAANTSIMSILVAMVAIGAMSGPIEARIHLDRIGSTNLRWVKPIALVADAIRDCSRRGDLVLDSFGGSGTTLIACERTNRKARLIELDPIYCDVAIRRWQTYSGKNAIHAATKRSFDDAEPMAVTPSKRRVAR